MLTEVLTGADLASRLRRSERTIKRWTAAGKLPPSRVIGGRRCWLASDVEGWLQSLPPATPAPAAEAVAGPQQP